MIEIKDLLSGLRNIVFREENKLELVRTAIGSVIGVEIKREDIKIKNNTVFLNLKPIYKSEIFLKKGEILSRMEMAVGGDTPLDIR